jgi:predicted transcriptional regulator
VTIPKRGNPEKISTPIELSIETEPIFLAQGQTIIKGGTWYEYKGKNYIITKDGRSIYSEDGLNRPSELAEIVIKDGTKIEQPISTTQSEIEKKTKEISDLEERLKEPLLRPVIFEDDYSPSQLRDLKETWAKQDEEERIIIRKEIAQKQAELKELEQQPILGVQPQADNTALDEFFERVARFVVTSDIEIKPITLVKQFNLGYNRATKIINQLEAAGIVEANTDDKPRKLMIQSEAELDSILENIKKPTTQSGSNPALSDVESTAKALRENEEKGGKPIPTTLIPKQEFEVLNNGNRGLNDIIAETYHKAKAKPENTRTEQEQELIKAVESALTGEAEKILEQQPISTTQSEIDTKKAEIEKEKASITNSEFTELKRLAKFFLENPKEPTVSESVVTRYPALFKALTDIERRKKQSLSEKEWSTGPVKGAYLRQESDGRWSSMYFKPSTTGVDGEGVYRNTKEEVIAELEKMYNAELAALQSVSTGGKANVVKVYHHTNVALQDFNFGSFQRGNQQISQFGDGLNASSTTTPFLIQRYGNPIEGEINDSDFVVIDANKSEKELYEELKAKGYKFNNPARGSYIGNNPAKEYDGAEKANVQPAIISLFNDFQKSNPQVKGVKVINHIIGGQKVDSFYVIYDAKSFYGPGSLSKTQPISTNQSEDLNYSTLLLKFKTDGLALGVSTSDMKEALNLAAETGQISLNHFTQFNVSAEDSAKLVTLLKDILAAKEVLVKLADDTIENAQEHANPVPSEEEETEDIFDFVEDNSLEVNLSDAPIPVKKSTGGVEGMKQEYPATSGAHRSTLFFEQRNKSGKIERRGIPVADDTTIFTVLDSSKLLPGTKVQIEIDFEYKGDMVLPDTQVSKTPKAVPQQTISAKDLLENLNSFPLEGTEEFEKLVQELPLKITLNGKTVQWLHLPKWILSKDPNTSGTGSEDYRNVVDSKIDPKTGEYIIEPGNALREAAYLASIRRSILKLLAAGETVEVEVSSKGEGILLPASEEYSAVNLKETRIQGGEKKNVAVPIAISTDTGLKGLENTPQISTQINPEYDIEPGRIVALIPMADGSRVPVSLKGKRLSELPNTVHTFHRALELFLGPLNAPEVETIESSTGFDIRDREGIRNYMAQYFTYFTSPTALRTGINLVLSNKTISVVTVTDAGTYETILELDPATQKLTRESTSALSKLLETRYRAVAFSNKDRNLVGLNDSSSSQFSYPQYSPETGWAVKNYPSYNDFLLKDLTSPVMPLNAADRGVEYTKEQGAEYPGKYYFYAVNPVTQYDFSPVLGRAKLGVNEALIPVGTATEVSESAQANKSAEKSFEEIMGIEDKAIPISSVGTQNTGIVNLDNLTELYNFTPQSDRNDLTPVEVLTRLRQLNVSHIPPGYNPFKRCT